MKILSIILIGLGSLLLLAGILSFFTGAGPDSEDIAYKIGYYSNFTEVFTTEDPPDPSKKIIFIVGALVSALFSIIIGFAGIKIRSKCIKYPGERPPMFIMSEP